MAYGILGRGRGAVAVLAAAGACWSLDLAGHVASGPSLDGSQLVLSSLLLAGAAGVLAGVAAGVRLGAPLTLTLFAAILGAAFGGPARGLYFALACAPLALPWAHRAHPAALGLLLGIALSACFVLAPRLWTLAGVTVPRDAVRADPWFAGLLLALVAGLVLAGAVTARLGRLGRVLPALGLAALVVALDAFASGRATPPPAYAAPRTATSAAPHVLLLVLDTVGADHLSLYGYGRDTTPELRRLVAEHPGARVYTWAFAPASWTPPSHASLLTGLLPHEHQVHEKTLERRARGVLHAETTLAELLRERGWRTATVTANRFLLAIEGLDRGFDWFVQPHHARPLDGFGERLRNRLLPGFGRVEPYPDADTVSLSILDFLEACSPGPCFVLGNYMDAHGPYLPPPPFAGRFVAELAPDAGGTSLCGDEPDAVLVARYDESIATLDAALGRLFAALAKRGLRDDAWIIVTSDHGESFGAHGVCSHGTSLYNAQTRIPLVVLPPRGVELSQCEAGVSLLDVTATVAAVAGVPDFGAGRDLREPCAAHPVAMSFYGRPHRAGRHGPQAGKPAQGVVLGTRKLLSFESHEELFELASDPGEKAPLREPPEPALEALRRHLPPAEPDPAQATAPSLSLHEVEALRALGYLYLDAEEEAGD